MNKETIFEDPNSHLINLPSSINSYVLNEVKWLRPDEYIRENNLHKRLIEKIPNKNHIKIRRFIRESLQISQQNNSLTNTNLKKASSSNDLFAFLDENYETYKMKLLNKEFSKLYKMELTLYVVNITERDETEEEINKRKEEFEQIIKTNNSKIDKKGKNINTEPFLEFSSSPIKIRTICPSNIDMTEKYPKFSKWIASILQIIKDLNITDAFNKKENIFNKIYPQLDGIPIYNPSGRYWVKLFHMGSYRKIEVDDKMPCGKYEEFLLPRCEKLEELWPAILTKALIKLFSYKFTNSNYSFEEVGDSAVIYALTGYIGEKIQLSSFNISEDEENKKLEISEIKKMMNFITRDDKYSNGQKFLIAYKSNEEKIEKNKFNLYEGNVNKPLLSNKRNSTMLSEPNHDFIRKLMEKNLSIPKMIREDKINMNSPLKSSSECDKVYKRTENGEFMLDKTQEISNRRKNIRGLTQKKLSTEQNFFKSQVPEKNYLIASENTIRKLFTNEKINNIFSDFAYSIVEIFSNGSFNMKRLKPIDFTDLIKKIENTKISFKKITNKEEKAIHIQNLKELKKRLKEEKIIRLEEIKKPGKNVFLVNIKTDSVDGNYNNKNFFIPYQTEQIEMAKKCIINNWHFPPPSFFENTYVKFSNPEFLPIMKNNNEEYNLRAPKKFSKGTEWTKEFYLNLINHEVEKYSSEIELFKRPVGDWIGESQFFDLFNNLIILHNPKYYKSSLNINRISCNFFNYLNHSNDSYTVFHFTTDSYSNLDVKQGINPINNNKIFDNKSSILILFEPFDINTSKNVKNTKYYLNADFYELEENKTLGKSCKKLKFQNFYSAIQLDLIEFSKEYILIFKGGLVPYGYYMRIFSDHNIEHISYFNYLKKFRNYKSFTFNLSHPNLEKNSFYSIARIRCTFTEKSDNTDTNFIFTLNNYEDKYYNKCLEFFLVRSSNIETKYNRQKIYSNEEFNLKSFINEDNFYIIAILNTNYNILETNFELEIVTNDKKLNFELIENTTSFEVKDQIVPNKHGIVLNELFYIPLNSIVCADLEIQLKKEKEVDGIDKNYNIRMILKISRDDTILYTSDFYNRTSIINFTLNNKKESLCISNNENSPFSVLCLLDLSECPSNIMSIHEYDSKYIWSIRVFASDTLVFFKNTLKEDNERNIKDKWEMDEPGRLEKAKRTRYKYLILEKKERGEILTEEEKKIIGEERIRKKKIATLITNLDMNEINSKRYSIKINEKNRPLLNTKLQLPVIEYIPTENEKLNWNKEIKSLDTYKSVATKNFIKYINAERVVKRYLRGYQKGTSYYCRTEDDIDSIRNSMVIAVDNYESQRRNEAEEYVKKMREIKERERYLFPRSQRNRNPIFKSLENLQKDREILIDKIYKINQTDLTLKNILENLNNWDLQSIITTYLEIKANNSPRNETLYEKVCKIISERKEEIIINDIKKFNPKDKIVLLKHLEDIRLNNWKIDEGVLKKLNELCC